MALLGFYPRRLQATHTKQRRIVLMSLFSLGICCWRLPYIICVLDDSHQAYTEPVPKSSCRREATHGRRDTNNAICFQHMRRSAPSPEACHAHDCYMCIVVALKLIDTDDPKGEWILLACLETASVCRAGGGACSPPKSRRNYYAEKLCGLACENESRSTPRSLFSDWLRMLVSVEC